MEPIIYPAIFHKQDKGYFVEFPDIPGCLTEGDTLIEAFNMAGDVLNIWFECNSGKPEPSNFEDIKVYGDDIKLLVKASLYKSNNYD